MRSPSLNDGGCGDGKLPTVMTENGANVVIPTNPVEQYSFHRFYCIDLTKVNALRSPSLNEGGCGDGKLPTVMTESEANVVIPTNPVE
ncbi:MAG: hypothetical protein E7596_06060 [Ruminococcaceae bacterium]|nr:hypothetical protein [Oscillospiraceae bacterium]